MIALAPCPICSHAVQPEQYERGWVIGCIGGRHCVQLYRGTSADEVVAAWNKAFGRDTPINNEERAIAPKVQDDA